MIFDYIPAGAEELEALWAHNIEKNPGDSRWVIWRDEYVGYNEKKMARTYAVTADGEAVGEGTLILSPDCGAVRGRLDLCNGKTVGNVNALRIRREFEGQGHISRMMRRLEKDAAEMGLTALTIGVEPRESRNLGIYLHWGYTEFLFFAVEDGDLVLYYRKRIGKNAQNAKTE